MESRFKRRMMIINIGAIVFMAVWILYAFQINKDYGWSLLMFFVIVTIPISIYHFAVKWWRRKNPEKWAQRFKSSARFEQALKAEGSDFSAILKAFASTLQAEVTPISSQQIGLEEKREISSHTSTIDGEWYKASVLRRIVAAIVDYFIIFFILIVLALLAFSVSGGNFSPLSYALFAIAIFLPFFVYPVFSVWKFGATLGKKLLKIQVVSITSTHVNFKQALVREVFGKAFSTLFLNLGYLWMLWDKDRQGWHDKLARTYVVTKIPTSSKTPILLYLILVPFIVIPPLLPFLVSTVPLVIDPTGWPKKTRDATRLYNYTDLERAMKKIESSGSLCGKNPTPCEGKSNENTNSRNSDGSGWVKVGLDKAGEYSLHQLPIDPLNTGEHVYRYCSDGVGWEINLKFENDQQFENMANDGGDNPGVFEIGNNLSICNLH